MASGAFKKFLSTIGFESIEGDSSYLEDEMTEEQAEETAVKEERQERRERRERTERRSAQARAEAKAEDTAEQEQPVAFNRSSRRAQNNVVTMNEARERVATSSRDRMMMKIVNPSSYDETKIVIDHLRSGKAIVLNIDEIDVKIAQRILDFVSGAVYSLDGNIQKVARNIYVVAPANVTVTAGLTEEIANSADPVTKEAPLR